MQKNEILMEKRGISFEDAIVAINNERILDRFDHPNQKKYKGQ